MQVAELAATQHGAFSRRQALGLGLSASGLGRRIATGLFRPVDDGVYVIKGARKGWLQDAMIACLATQGIASHRTAGKLWGLPVPGDARAIDVLVPAARRPRSTRAIHVHRTRGQISSELRSGVPTSPLKDTLLQLADALPTAALLRAVDAALTLKPGVLYDLADTLVTARRGHRASLKFRDLIVELLPDEGARAALPTGDGVQAGLDVAWPKRRVGVALFDHQDHGQGGALDALAGQGWTVLVTHARETPRALGARLRPHFR